MAVLLCRSQETVRGRELWNDVMNDWDYEDDLPSQEAVDRCCAKIRQANDLLNEAHKEMTDTLHDMAKRIILSELQVTDEITCDMRNSYFRYHIQHMVGRVMTNTNLSEPLNK